MDMMCKNGSVVEALNVNIYGNKGETLVLAHGFGEDNSSWHLLVPLLAYYFKVVVFDLVISPNVDPKLYDPKRYTRNFTAYADDLICLLDQLHVENTIYLGHSMSAMVGCVAAIKRPQLFSHLILLSGSPRYLNDPDGYVGGFNRSEIDGLLQQINDNYSVWVDDFATKVIGVNNKAATDEFENSLRRMKPGIAYSVAEAVFFSDLRNKLPQVSVKCTIIQSKKDFVVPKQVAFYIKSKLGSSDTAVVKILDTEGHFPHLTACKLLFKVLKEVLNF